MAPTLALAHDYLTQKGGAERVVLSLAKAFPGSRLYTALYDAESTFPLPAETEVKTSFLDKIPAFKRNHRLAFLLYPLAFAALKAEADLVLCSSSGWAHGISASGLKVVYCYTPPRWLYLAHDYLKGMSFATKAADKIASPFLRAWDKRAARSCAAYIAVSSIVRKRIEDIYRVEPEVIHPPLTFAGSGPTQPVEQAGDEFFLTVARLLPYKNVDAVVAAFRQLPWRLVVVGDGPMAGRLEQIAPPNVVFIRNASDSQLRWLYSKCIGLVSAAFEDFGLTPLEAALFGKPAAVLRYGGHLDTVIEGRTGVFFDEPTPSSIAEALRQLAEASWKEEDLKRHAESFSEERFFAEIRRALERISGIRLPEGPFGQAEQRPPTTTVC
jgi:glycosyltransferase involved in cell wall biosynthesis